MPGIILSRHTSHTALHNLSPWHMSKSTVLNSSRQRGFVHFSFCYSHSEFLTSFAPTCTIYSHRRSTWVSTPSDADSYQTQTELHLTYLHISLAILLPCFIFLFCTLTLPDINIFEFVHCQPLSLKCKLHEGETYCVCLCIPFLEQYDTHWQK